MDHSYQSITAAATDAIEAMAREPRDTVISDASSVHALALSVYWSWSHHVGKEARPEDCERMEQLIRSMRRTACTPRPR